MDGEVKTPTREWYEFVWWVDEETDEDFDPNAPVTWDKKFYAKWKCAQWYVGKQWQCVKEEPKPSWGSSGWWGGGWWWATKPDTPKDEQQPAEPSQSDASLWTDVKEPETNTGSNIQTWSQVDPSEQTTQNDESNTQASSTSSQNNWKSYTQEFQQAYEFARENGITTMSTIQKAQMNWKLTRIQMAKMLSQYAINVLWMDPDISKWIADFSDVTRKMNKDYDNWVTLAYQLWIMWQNMPNNKFRPNDEVSRAEFVTALSRLLYSTLDGKYESTPKYYINHMERLVKEWIITKDDPKMKELRGYVMIMLMRSAE